MQSLQGERNTFPDAKFLR